MPHQAETPSAVFNTSHSIYHHPSGLSFPDVHETGTGDVAQPGVLSNASAEPTSVGYIPSSTAENSDTSLHAFAYPQPPSAQNSTSGYGDSTGRLSGPNYSRNTEKQAPISGTSLPGGQAPRAPEPSTIATDQQSSWSSLANTTSQPAKASPRRARAKKPATISQGYDDIRRQPTPTNKGSASQSTSRTARTARDSPNQPPAQPARAASRQSNRAATVTPQPAIPDQAHGYSQYQTAENTEAESSMDRISYQPYSHRGSNQQGSYSSAENSYNVRAPTTAAPTYPETVSQNVASSYPMNPSTTTSTAQWSASTSSPQTRNAHVYNATQSAAANTSYNTASNTSQSQMLQDFSVRPTASQPRKSSSGYGQQQIQQQHRPQPKPEQPQQQSYNGYMNNMAQHRQQSQQAQQQQQTQQSNNNAYQDWGYGFGATANNTTSSTGYPNSAATSGNAASSSANNAYSTSAGNTSHGSLSHAHGHDHGHTTGHSGHSHGHSHGHGSHGAGNTAVQHQEHHRPMNLSGRTYSSVDGGDPSLLYDLLRSNPAG